MATPTPYVYQELIDKLKVAFGSVPAREVISALVDLEVKLRVQKMYVQQLRSGLETYLPGPFWTEVKAATKAAEDQGKHAQWVLNVTDPDSSMNA